MAMEDQALSLYAAKNGIIDEVSTEEVAEFEKKILRTFHDSHKDILEEIRTTGDISDELSEKIKAAMNAILEDYRLVKGA